jgi:hypothetical protein
MGLRYQNTVCGRQIRASSTTFVQLFGRAKRKNDCGESTAALGADEKGGYEAIFSL